MGKPDKEFWESTLVFILVAAFLILTMKACDQPVRNPEDPRYNVSDPKHYPSE